MVFLADGDVLPELLDDVRGKGFAPLAPEVGVFFGTVNEVIHFHGWHPAQHFEAAFMTPDVVAAFKYASGQE